MEFYSKEESAYLEAMLGDAKHFNDFISTPRSMYTVPKAILKCTDQHTLAIVFTDIFDKNRYEIWLLKNQQINGHPWREGADLFECSKAFDSVWLAISAAVSLMEKLSEEPS